MKWSVSTTKMFQSCPRKYYYQQILADRKSDDPRAQESFALKQLKNLYLWRGNLVDGVISRYVVPRINRHEEIHEGQVLAHARELIHADLDAFKTKITKSSKNLPDGNNLGFYELEYGVEVTLDTLTNVENEIITSLKNFINSKLLSEIIKDKSYLVAQRRLLFSLGTCKISCMPDLIIFPNSGVPKIIDWKVEYALRDHWIQLGIYGYALSKINPHKDFPSKWVDFIKDPRKIDLSEVQLLRNKEKKYRIKDEDIIEIQDYIHISARKIARLIGNEKTVDMNQFPITENPITCQNCQYKKICWREMQNAQI